MVTFTIKNRKENRSEQVTVTAVEFIRRFLLHSLPKRFVRIRQYGFLANRNRSQNLTAIRRLMGVSDPSEKQIASVEEMMHKLTGIDISLCPGLPQRPDAVVLGDTKEARTTTQSPCCCGCLTGLLEI
jgi:hypothetical protein